MAAVTIEHISKSYGVHLALDNFDLRVAEGEFTVIVGPSGSGKSTLLRIIAGLDRPDRGRVFIGGRDMTPLSPGQRNLAMVFQGFALYPSMTVRENLVFALKANKVDALEISKRLSTIAELLDIGPVLDRLPASLSGGQRQRVALGRAIMRQPALFLFDEPLSNVDLKLRATLRREILELCRKIAATAIYVTHDQTEAMTMADQLVVLHSGRVMQKGPPLTIYDDPKNLFVASFLGSPGINLLPFERVAEGFRLNHSDHVIALPSFCAAAQSDALILGIRPEHIATSPPDKDCLALPVYVHSVEQLGAETIVYGKLGCHEVLVRTKRGLYQLKQVVDFSVRLSDVLLFDALSGARLPWRAP